MIQHELCRRYIDASRVDVRVIHGVCYMSGQISKLRSHPEVDLNHEAEVIRKCVRQLTGIRDVVWDVYMRQ
jgi:osmotically-inducible protein OsmY